MTILVVPDGFKDSLSSLEVSKAILNGIAACNTKIETHSIFASDGGDGFLEVVKYYKPSLTAVTGKTVDALGRIIEARYLWDQSSKTAYVELAAASGIELLAKEDRRVMQTSTLGTGLQLREAILKGAQTIYVGLGGSATNDAGTGIATGLGYKFLDIEGAPVSPCGGTLGDIKHIEVTKSRQQLPEIHAINDVQNPLFGPNGAAYVYARQKGAIPAEIKLLDHGLQHISELVKKELSIEAAQLPGAGAAGGAAYGLHVFCGASFIPGTEFVLGLTQFDELIATKTIDLIITGEGKIDKQTQHGKLISGLIQKAKRHRIPVAAVCGKLDLTQEEISSLGLVDAIEIYNPTKPKEYSYTNASKLITEAIKTMLARFN